MKRKRRIKCDEVKPSCGACIRSGWKCEGYPIADKRTATQTPDVVLNISAYSIPFQIPGSKRDRQVIHYFCTQAASDLSGFVPSDFWRKTLLQASCNEPTVRQALLALSSLHLDYITSDMPRSRVATSYTIQQYGKALKCLRKRIEEPSPEAIRVALLCSIVFFSFESILGNSDSAVQQLNGGLALLISVQKNNHGTIAEAESIEDTFARLDIQSTIFDDEKAPQLDLSTKSRREAKIVTLSEQPFLDLQGAQRELVTLQNWMWHLLISNNSYKFVSAESLPMSLTLEKAQLEEELQLWSKGYDDLTVTRQDVDSSLSYGTSALKIQYYICQMLLASNFPHDDTVFGASPNPQAERVMDLAEGVLEHIQEQDRLWRTVQSPRRSFSAESGIVAPLTLLAIKCADPLIVERAGRVLVQVQRQEGLYDTASLLSLTQHLKQLQGIRVTEEEDVLASLEQSVLDIVDGASAGLALCEQLVPPSILPTQA